MKAFKGRLMVLKGRAVTLLVPLLFVATLASADTAGGAGNGPAASGMSPLVMIFLGLLAVIILLQLIPAMVLFGSLIMAVFKRSTKKAAATSGEET